MKLTEEHAARIYIEAAEWTDEWAEREPSEPTKQQTNAMFVHQIHARYDFAAQVTPVPQDGDERARFDEWYASQWPLSFAAIKSDTTDDDDDVWDSYRMAELAWQAALASNRAAAVAAVHPTPISITTDQIAEIAVKYNLGNPRLDALRGFVNEVIIVNGAEYAKSE